MLWKHVSLNKSLCLGIICLTNSPENQHSVSGSPLQGPAACRHTQYWWLSLVCHPSTPKFVGLPSVGQLWFQAHHPAAGLQYLLLLRVKKHDTCKYSVKMIIYPASVFRGLKLFSQLPKSWRFVSRRKADSNSSSSLPWMAVSASRWPCSQQAYCSLLRIWHRKIHAILFVWEC